MILSLISQKGGVGKSTLARLLGVEMQRAGWSVMIADLDAAQGTSTQWKLRRDREEVDPDVAVIKYRSVQAALKDAARYDLAILDGPAHAERGGVTMAKASDLIILPSSYSLDDLEPQARVAYDLVDAGIPDDRVWVSMMRTKGTASEQGQVENWLRKAQLNVFKHQLRELTSIRQAHMFGRAASETSHSNINEEARAVASEIAKRLTEGG